MEDKDKTENAKEAEVRHLDNRVKWKGVGEEALRKMGKRELNDYINLLEKTIYDVHTHFYYMSPRIERLEGGMSGLKVESIGFDGRINDIAKIVLMASLRMYEVHSTPFVPVPVPQDTRVMKIGKKS